VAGVFDPSRHLPPIHQRRRRFRGFWLLLAFGLVLGPGTGPATGQERPDAPAPAERDDIEPDVEGLEVEPTDAELAPPGGPSEGIEEIVVEGQRSVGIEVDAPVSVTAFGQEDLVALGVEDVADIAEFTPSLEIRTAGATTPTFFIRGVGLNDFTANAAGAVAIYQDGVALDLPALQLGQIFDVERVEVLRGPQGTGSGRNASAGAIKVYSRKPTGEFGGALRMDYGNFDLLDFEGAVEAPLIADTLSTRMAFRLTRRDGFVRNRCGGFSQQELDAKAALNQRACGEQAIGSIPADLGTELNNLDIWAARGQLRFLPPDTDMDWLLNLHGSEVNQLGTVGQAIGTDAGFFGSATAQPQYTQPEIRDEIEAIQDSLGINDLPPSPRPCAVRPDCRAIVTASREALAENLASKRPLDTKPFEGDYNVVGFEKQDSFGGFLRGEWDLGALGLTSISAYDWYDRARLLDADYTPNTLFEFDILDTAWQFTQELRAGGGLDGAPFGWNTGAYFLNGTLDYTQDTLAGGDIQGLFQVYQQKTWSLGIFGDFSWEFLDDFSLEGGVRYNWERKDFDVEAIRRQRDVCRDLIIGGSVVIQALPCFDSVTFSAPTGALSLKYFFNEDVSAYWKYSRGWKGPQFNVGDGQTNNTITVAEPETIDAFEVGFNGTWFDSRLNLKGALFWYNYENYQVFLITNDFSSPPQRVVENASDARIYGAELEAKGEPLERLVMTVRFGWLESRFLDFTDSGIRRLVLSGDPPPPPQVTEVPIDYTGNRLPNTPRFKLSGSVEYTGELGRYGSLIPRYDFSWTDDVFFDPSEGFGAPNNQGATFLPEFAIGQKAYWLHNVRLSYRSPGSNIEVAGWVRNLTDEVYKTLAFDASVSAGLVGNFVGDPRTYGVSVAVAF
jgi:iron complex outermembrane receptor protein